MKASHNITDGIWRADATTSSVFKYRWTQAPTLAEYKDYLASHWCCCFLTAGPPLESNADSAQTAWTQTGFKKTKRASADCSSSFFLTALSPFGHLRGRHSQDIAQLLGSLLFSVTGTCSHPQEGTPRGHQNKSVVAVQLRGRRVELRGQGDIIELKSWRVAVIVFSGTILTLFWHASLLTRCNDNVTCPRCPGDTNM